MNVCFGEFYNFELVLGEVWCFKGPSPCRVLVRVRVFPRLCVGSGTLKTQNSHKSVICRWWCAHCMIAPPPPPPPLPPPPHTHTKKKNVTKPVIPSYKFTKSNTTANYKLFYGGCRLWDGQRYRTRTRYHVLPNQIDHVICRLFT